jgi:ABC-type sugar transport system permease subunit
VGLGSAYGVVILVAVIAVATIFVRYIDNLNRQRGRAEA